MYNVIIKHDATSSSSSSLDNANIYFNKKYSGNNSLVRTDTLIKNIAEIIHWSGQPVFGSPKHPTFNMRCKGKRQTIGSKCYRAFKGIYMVFSLVPNDASWSVASRKNKNCQYNWQNFFPEILQNATSGLLLFQKMSTFYLPHTSFPNSHAILSKQKDSVRIVYLNRRLNVMSKNRGK